MKKNKKRKSSWRTEHNNRSKQSRDESGWGEMRFICFVIGEAVRGGRRCEFTHCVNNTTTKLCTQEAKKISVNVNEEKYQISLYTSVKNLKFTLSTLDDGGKSSHIFFSLALARGKVAMTRGWLLAWVSCAQKLCLKKKMFFSSTREKILSSWEISEWVMPAKFVRALISYRQRRWTTSVILFCIIYKYCRESAR